MIGGHQGGVIRQTFAIAEYEDGAVAEILPENIRFTDKQMKQPPAAPPPPPAPGPEDIEYRW